MHIEVHGNGPDLVLIHGWAMHGGIFAPLLSPLMEHFRVHLVDLPGHGRSARQALSFESGRCAEQLLDRTPPALWVGWSLGGLIALRAAALRPDRVQALAPMAANPRFVLAEDWPHGVEATVFGGFAQGLRSDWRRTIERFLALETHGSERAQTELRNLRAHVFERGEPDLDVLGSGLEALEGGDLRELVGRLRMPSLWIAGRRDRLVPLAAMRWAAARAPGADLLELAGGHAPFLSQPEDIAAGLVALARRAGIG